MNKFALFLCFILVLNSAKSETDLVEQIYDYFTIVLKGMSKNNGQECSNVFANNKDKLLGIVREIVEKAKSGTSLGKILPSYLSKVLVIDGIGTKCNLIFALNIVGKFESENGIKEIGDVISSKYKDIYQNIQTISNSQSLDDKLIAGGRILALLLDFYVN